MTTNTLGVASRHSTLPDRAEREAWVRARLQEVGARAMDLHVMDEKSFPYMLRLMARASRDGAVDPRDARRVDMMRGVNAHTKRTRGGGLYPWSPDIYRECVYTIDWEDGSWNVQEPQSKL